MALETVALDGITVTTSALGPLFGPYIDTDWPAAKAGLEKRLAG